MYEMGGKVFHYQKCLQFSDVLIIADWHKAYIPEAKVNYA